MLLISFKAMESSALRVIDTNQLAALDTPVDQKNILKSRLRPRVIIENACASPPFSSKIEQDLDDDDDDDEDFVMNYDGNINTKSDPWVRPSTKVSLPPVIAQEASTSLAADEAIVSRQTPAQLEAHKEPLLAALADVPPASIPRQLAHSPLLSFCMALFAYSGYEFEAM